MTQARERRSIRTSTLLADIIRHIQREDLAAGDRLVELRLAQELGVSRSPLRRALNELAGRGLIAARPNRGFTLLKTPEDHAFRALLGQDDGDDSLYLEIAADRLDGRLPDVITENALVRHYGLSRTETARILARMAGEGWIERRTGYGWQFLPMFPTREAYLHGYRYRLLVEPAAILEPGFAISGETLDRLEAEQQTMVSAAESRPTVMAMFEAGCSFHEGIVAASGNPFMLDAVQRINRMRRLIEYRALAPGLVTAQSCEHLDILRALRRNDRQGAADLMRAHLANASNLKLEKLKVGDAIGFAQATF